MSLLLCVGALLAHPVPSGDTALSASSSKLSLVPPTLPAAAAQEAVSFLQEGDDAVLADGESGGNGKKVLKKKIKALEKRTDARRKRMANQHAKKKIKKKIKGTEKVTDAKKRKDNAAEKKAEQEDGDDGAVSFLQYEAATPAILQPHELSLLLKKLVSKSSDKNDDDPAEDDGEDEGEDEGEGEGPDFCDKAVQKMFFDMIDEDHSGEVTEDELVDFAKENMCEEETEDECVQDTKDLFDHMDTGEKDGKISPEEFGDFVDTMMGCNANGKARTNLLQYEAATPAILQPHELSLLLKKLVSKSSDKNDDDPAEDDGEDEGEDEGEGEGPDFCDKAVQKMFFDMIDEDHSGEVTEDELVDFAKENMCEEETEDECVQDTKDLFDHMDTGEKDGKISPEEFGDFVDTMMGCNANGKARTTLKAHTAGGAKKKLKKKLKAMEKKEEARRKQSTNQHAKKVIKKHIKASEKIAEAKERAHAAAARKAANKPEDGDDEGEAM